IARSANREAVSCFDQALEVLTQVPESPGNSEVAIDLYLELCIPLHAAGQLVRAAHCAKMAEGLARQLGDSHRVSRASVYRCHHCRMVGDMAEAEAAGRGALEIATTLGDPQLTIAASYSLGLVASYLGEYAEAEDLLRKAIHLVDGHRIYHRCGLD